MSNYIPIMATLYEIKENKAVYDVHGSFGLTLEYMQEIHIYSEMKQDKREVILTHEVLHAITSSLGFKDISENEIFIHALSEALHISFEIKPKLIIKNEKI